MISGLFIAASSAINYQNGREQRALQEELHGQDRQDAAQRAERGFGLQERQVILQETQARELAIRYRDEVERRIKEIDEGRSAASLARVIAPSTNGWYLHDPYGDDNPGVKSLRVLFQRGASMSYVEQAINDAIKRHGQKGAARPIHFLKGIWNEQAEPGSWIAAELHSWNRKIPTLIVRVEPASGNRLLLEADIFGFPMAGNSFKSALPLGYIPNDPEQIERALQLVTLAIADMHFFSVYAKMPVLPSVLPELLPPGEKSDPVIRELVESYRQTMNAIAAEKPEIGLYAALQLAESFTALPDKRYAREQLAEIVAATRTILPDQPGLAAKLKDLYEKAGAPEEAARLTAMVQEQKGLSAPDKRKLLEAHL